METKNPQSSRSLHDHLDAVARVTQQWARDQLLARIDGHLAERRAHWANSDAPRPTPGRARSMVRQAARTNAVYAGGLSILPSATALATIPVELELSLHLLTDLIHDLAMAYGEDHQVDAELVLALLLEGDERAMFDLVRIRDDGPTLVQRPGRAWMKTLASLAGRRLAMRVARLALGRLVPVAGTVALAWWARKRTRAIGFAANEAFASGLMFVEADAETLEATAAAMEQELAAPAPLDAAEIGDAPGIDDAVVRARYDLLLDMLAHVKKPTKKQLDALARVAEAWSTDASPLPAPERGTGEVLPNVALLAERATPEALLADASAVGRLGRGVPRDWAHGLGASFGLSADEVDAILAEPPRSSIEALQAA